MNKGVSVSVGAAVAVTAVILAVMVGFLCKPIRTSAAGSQTDISISDMSDHCGAEPLEYFEETEAEFAEETESGVSAVYEEHRKYADSASTASPESRAFFDKCAGLKWGYFDLGKRSNGKSRQLLYDKIYQSMMNAWNSTSDLTDAKVKEDGYNYDLARITFSNLGLSKAEAKEVFFAFIHDNPIFYFMSKTYATVPLIYKDGSTGEALKIYIYKDFLTASRRKACQDAIKKYINNAASCYKSGETTYANVRRFYSKVASDITYSRVSGPVLYGNYYHCCRNILGGIMYGKGVCESYAKILQVLCSYYGIDSVYVVGTTSGDENHVWNVIRIDDGIFYCFDVTWDDNKDNNYTYFAKGTNTFYTGHKPQASGSDADSQFFYALPTDISKTDFDMFKLKKHTHDMGAWTVYRAAACNLEGVEIRNCKSCGHYEVRIVNKAAHKFTDKKVAPTCTAQGYTEHKCTVCGTTVKDTYVDMLPHSFVDTVKQPTCTEGGWTEHKCSVCGFTKKDTETAAKGHSFADNVIPSTCKDYGRKEHKCTVCGYVSGSEELPLGGHSFKQTSVTAATCTADGKITLKCETCGAVQEKILKATGHQYTAEVTAPTATTDGFTKHVCSVCGDTYTDAVIPAGGGEYVLTSSSEPTCVNVGEHIYTCADNGKSYTKIIEAKGHSFTETVHAPTCKAKGYTEHVCSVCGERYTDQEVPQKSHHYTAKVVPATVTEGGYTLHTCTECGDTWRDNETPKLTTTTVCKVKAVYGKALASGEIKAVINNVSGKKAAGAIVQADGTIISDKALAEGSYKVVITRAGLAPRTESFTVKGGRSSVGEVKLCAYGDLTGDGEIDTADIAMLQQMISKWNVKPVYPETADMNGNGSYDTEELASLQQYVSGWNVKLGK